jgi:hypothetical protein
MSSWFVFNVAGSAENGTRRLQFVRRAAKTYRAGWIFSALQPQANAPCRSLSRPGQNMAR